MLSEKDIAVDYHERLAEAVDYYGIAQYVAQAEAKEWMIEKLVDMGYEKRKASVMLLKAINKYKEM